MAFRKSGMDWVLMLIAYPFQLLPRIIKAWDFQSKEPQRHRVHREFKTTDMES
jgi:hypothetical protein